MERSTAKDETGRAPAPVGSGNEYAIRRLTDPLGRQTQYTYTPSGEISSITDPLTRTTVLSYTAQGWRSAVTTPATTPMVVRVDVLTES